MYEDLSSIRRISVVQPDGENEMELLVVDVYCKFDI